MNNTKSHKSRVCRNPECGVEFVVEVRGQMRCPVCRQAKADAKAAALAARPFEVCRTCKVPKQDCSMLGFCAACRKEQRAAGAKRREEIYLECCRKREEEAAKREAETTKNERRQEIKARLDQLPLPERLEVIMSMLDFLFRKEEEITVTENTFNPEEVPADNQDDIDSAFGKLMEGLDL